jgi:Mn-containing catalase
VPTLAPPRPDSGAQSDQISAASPAANDLLAGGTPSVA